MKLSDYVVKFFEDNGVKDVFMLTGGGCMHLVDSFGSSKKIKYTCTHHEQSAAMAAEAYSKLTGDISLTLVTSGPGATNAITGVVGAYQDSVPCIFISGQSKKKQTVYDAQIPHLRQFGVQEVNIIPIVESITKYCVFVDEAEKIRYYLEKALHMAKEGRPGPVWIDIPLDMQSSIINENELVGFSENELELSYKHIPSESEIGYVVEALKTAKRPVVIAGHGIRLAGAINEFEQFIDKHQMPVVTPIMGIDLLATDNQHNIGRVGTKGTRAGNFAMQNADVIIAIGSRMAVSVVGHEYSLFAREAKIIVVDIDPYEHKKQTIKIDKFINADAKCFLNALAEVPVDNDMNYGTWLSKCNIWKAKYPVCLAEYDDCSNGINYYKFVDALTTITNENTPIISDAGSAFYVVSQAIKLKKGQRYITSGALATMGFGLPAAIGVSVAHEGPVVTITGDGSFQQNIQELSVVKHHNMPIKIFVMNNNGYFSIRQTQTKFFSSNFVGESVQSGIDFPDTKKIADAYGIEYHFIDNIEKLNNQLEYILNSEEPMVIEVKLLADQAIIPTNSAFIKPDGLMVSKPLEDMAPFLSRDEFMENMIVKPVNE